MSQETLQKAIDERKKLIREAEKAGMSETLLRKIQTLPLHTDTPFFGKADPSMSRLLRCVMDDKKTMSETNLADFADIVSLPQKSKQILESYILNEMRIKEIQRKKVRRQELLNGTVNFLDELISDPESLVKAANINVGAILGAAGKIIKHRETLFALKKKAAGGKNTLGATVLIHKDKPNAANKAFLIDLLEYPPFWNMLERNSQKLNEAIRNPGLVEYLDKALDPILNPDQAAKDKKVSETKKDDSPNILPAKLIIGAMLNAAATPAAKQFFEQSQHFADTISYFIANSKALKAYIRKYDVDPAILNDSKAVVNLVIPLLKNSEAIAKLYGDVMETSIPKDELEKLTEDAQKLKKREMARAQLRVVSTAIDLLTTNEFKANIQAFGGFIKKHADDCVRIIQGNIEYNETIDEALKEYGIDRKVIQSLTPILIQILQGAFRDIDQYEHILDAFKSLMNPDVQRMSVKSDEIEEAMQDENLETIKEQLQKVASSNPKDIELLEIIRDAKDIDGLKTSIDLTLAKRTRHNLVVSIIGSPEENLVDLKKKLSDVCSTDPQDAKLLSIIEKAKSPEELKESIEKELLERQASNAVMLIISGGESLINENKDIQDAIQEKIPQLLREHGNSITEMVATIVEKNIDTPAREAAKQKDKKAEMVLPPLAPIIRKAMPHINQLLSEGLTDTGALFKIAKLALNGDASKMLEAIGELAERTSLDNVKNNLLGILREYKEGVMKAREAASQLPKQPPIREEADPLTQSFVDLGEEKKPTDALDVLLALEKQISPEQMLINALKDMPEIKKMFGVEEKDEAAYQAFLTDISPILTGIAFNLVHLNAGDLVRKVAVIIENDPEGKLVEQKKQAMSDLIEAIRKFCQTPEAKKLLSEKLPEALNQHKELFAAMLAKQLDAIHIPLPPEQLKPLITRAIPLIGVLLRDTNQLFAIAEDFRVGEVFKGAGKAAELLRDEAVMKRIQIMRRFLARNHETLGDSIASFLALGDSPLQERVPALKHLNCEKAAKLITTPEFFAFLEAIPDVMGRDGNDLFVIQQVFAQLANPDLTAQEKADLNLVLYTTIDHILRKPGVQKLLKEHIPTFLNKHAEMIADIAAPIVKEAGFDLSPELIEQAVTRVAPLISGVANHTTTLTEAMTDFSSGNTMQGAAKAATIIKDRTLMDGLKGLGSFIKDNHVEIAAVANNYLEDNSDLIKGVPGLDKVDMEKAVLLIGQPEIWTLLEAAPDILGNDGSDIDAIIKILTELADPDLTAQEKHDLNKELYKKVGAIVTKPGVVKLLQNRLPDLLKNNAKLIAEVAAPIVKAAGFDLPPEVLKGPITHAGSLIRAMAPHTDTLIAAMHDFNDQKTDKKGNKAMEGLAKIVGVLQDGPVHSAIQEFQDNIGSNVQIYGDVIDTYLKSTPLLKDMDGHKLARVLANKEVLDNAIKLMDKISNPESNVQESTFTLGVSLLKNPDVRSLGWSAFKLMVSKFFRSAFTLPLLGEKVAGDDMRTILESVDHSDSEDKKQPRKNDLIDLAAVMAEHYKERQGKSGFTNKIVRHMLKHSTFEHLNLENASFEKMHISGINFSSAKLLNTSFKGSNLSGCDFKDVVVLGKLELGGATLDEKSAHHLLPAIAAYNQKADKAQKISLQGITLKGDLSELIIKKGMDFTGVKMSEKAHDNLQKAVASSKLDKEDKKEVEETLKCVVIVKESDKVSTQLEEARADRLDKGRDISPSTPPVA